MTAMICTLAIVMINLPLHRYLLLDGSEAHKQVRPKLGPYVFYVLHAFCWAFGTLSVAFGLLAGVLSMIGGGSSENVDLWPLNTAPGIFLSVVLAPSALRLDLARRSHQPQPSNQRWLSYKDGFLITGPLSSELLPVAIVLAIVSFAQTLLSFTPTGLTVPIYAALATTAIYLQAAQVSGILSVLYGSLIQGRRL